MDATQLTNTIDQIIQAARELLPKYLADPADRQLVMATSPCALWMKMGKSTGDVGR